MESNSFVPPQHVLNNRPASPPIRMKILKRPEQKEKVEDSTRNQHLSIKTYAQREENYNRVRERIMGKQDNGPFRTHNNSRRNNRNRGNKNRNNQVNHGSKKGGRKSNGSSPTQLLNSKLR